MSLWYLFICGLFVFVALVPAHESFDPRSVALMDAACWAVAVVYGLLFLKSNAQP